MIFQPRKPQLQGAGTEERKMEAPKCPECGKPLERVNEDTYEIYQYDSGRYILVGEGINIYCPYCGADLEDLYPDGVCNWRQ